MKNILFFGLGNMGGPMALNLKNKGHHVVGFDVNQDILKSYEAKGLSTTTSPQNILETIDVVISMLPNDDIVLGLYLGKGSEKGILEKLHPGSLIIDSSTASPQVAQKIYQEAKNKDIMMIDAPVSGGVAGATQGTLTFIVGGEQNHLDSAMDILKAMGQNIMHAGPIGAGQVAKLANNMLLAIHMIGTSEALNLASKFGLDLKVISEIMKKSSGDNWSLQKYNPVPGIMENVPSSKDYQGGFASVLMLKDLTLAHKMQEKTDAKTPLGELALKLYQEHAKEHGQKDFSSIIQSL